MSLARIEYSVYAARRTRAEDGSWADPKTLTCEGCRKPIEKGTRYAHFKVGFRSRYVHTYHAGCPIKDSVRESGKMSGVYAGTESAQDAINALGWGGDAESFIADIKSALESAAEDWRSVGEEYREAAEASPTGMVFGVDYNEAADSIESAADELDGWDPDADEPEFCDNHGEDAIGDGPEQYANDGDLAEARRGCEDCQSLAETWVEDVRQSAIDAMDEASGNIEVG